MCGRVGDKAQFKGGEVKEIKINRQRVGEKERRPETEGLMKRETDRQTEGYMTSLSLSLTMAPHVVPSLAGELLESGMWNVGFQACK